MPAPTLSNGYPWSSGQRVNSSRLNQMVNSATIQVSGAGKVPVRLLASSGAGACDGEADLADFVTTRNRPSRVQINGLTTLSYSATTDLNFDSGTDLRSVTLAGNITLTTSNRGAGKNIVLRIIADASTRTLTFPAGWTFVTAKPASIAANKTATLVLICTDANDSGILAAYSVES